MTAYRRKMPKPPAHVAARLSAQTMSDRQAKRLAAGGSLESKPGDYGHLGDDEDRRRRDARRAIEHRAFCLKNGLDPEEV